MVRIGTFYHNLELKGIEFREIPYEIIRLSVLFFYGYSGAYGGIFKPLGGCVFRLDCRVLFTLVNKRHLKSSTHYFHA